MLAKDGTVYLIGHCRANRAGKGDNGVLQAFIGEKPFSRAATADKDGNSHFYSGECENPDGGRGP
ncbi:hypothetical protein ACIP93_35775 [Streptomyces sp. NPDC088745]|uniref:hypothetical protein n=1 Tax=Streptomyces sp. NPDC088745 TaxID=3365884 RepID=UPI0038120910